MEYKIINGAITFGTNTILEEINFEINKNDKIAIVGRNGSGGIQAAQQHYGISDARRTGAESVGGRPFGEFGFR